jgi:hypothetical protein
MEVTHLIILVATRVILSHPQYEVEDRHKGTNSVWIPTEHDVAEANIVIRRDVAGGHTRKRRLQSVVEDHIKSTRLTREAHLLIQLDILHHLESQREVTQENMNAQQPDDAEVAQHAIKRAYTIFTDDFSRLGHQHASKQGG